MSTWIASTLSRVATDLSYFHDFGNIPDDMLDSAVVSLERAFKEIVIMDTLSSLTQSQREAYHLIRTSLSELRFHLESRQNNDESLPVVLPISVGCVG